MELSIDTASALASVALSEEGGLLAELTWRSERNHTVELLPAVQRLLEQAGRDKREIRALFVCTGPGMYTGLRVGISTAKGMARALEAPLLGAGRLELDAYPHRSFPGTVVAVHRAGRGELAWAAYGGDPRRELSPPKLSGPEELAEEIDAGSLVTGEVDERLEELVKDRAVVAKGTAAVRRAGALAELGWQRLQEGEPAEPALVNAVYLRPPAIGPQAPSGG